MVRSGSIYAARLLKADYQFRFQPENEEPKYGWRTCLKIENPNAKNQIIKGQPLSRQKPCKNQPKSTEEPHGSPTNVPVFTGDPDGPVIMVRSNMQLATRCQHPAQAMQIHQNLQRSRCGAQPQNPNTMEIQRIPKSTEKPLQRNTVRKIHKICREPTAENQIQTKSSRS